MKKRYVLTVTVDKNGLHKNSKSEGFSYPELIGILHYETTDLLNTFKDNMIYDKKPLDKSK